MAKRISIINFKGGVGKTTLAFHMGTWLAYAHEAKVLLVDMDHQSSLSILCMGADSWLRAVESEKTISQLFHGFFANRNFSLGRTIIAKAPMNRLVTDYANLDIVPASLELDDIEIGLTATHLGDPIHSEWNKRTLVCRWIEDSEIDEEYDYIIFDCPPATKIVAQNAVAASHGYIIPVIPEAVMERGTPHLHRMIQSGIDKRLKMLSQVGEHRSIYVPDTMLIGLVITQLQVARGGSTLDHRQHLQTLEQRWGDLLMGPYILRGTGVSESLAQGLPVFNFSHTQKIGDREINDRYAELIDEISNRTHNL